MNNENFRFTKADCKRIVEMNKKKLAEFRHEYYLENRTEILQKAKDRYQAKKANLTK